MLFTLIFTMVNCGMLYALVKSPLINYAHLITIASYLIGLIMGGVASYIAASREE